MAEFKLERFKYNWKGDWTPGTSYKRDDVVRVNGNSYVCIVTHLSDPIFRNDLEAILPGSNPPQPQPRWVVMTSSKSFQGYYTPGTVYDLGDVVQYDGVLWVCTKSHTATGDPSEEENWTVFADHINFKGNWSSATTYGPGALVKYNGIVYKSTNTHVSQNTLEENIDDWKIFNEGIEYRGEWLTGEEYRKNDLVKYGPTVFRCIETHTASDLSIDDTKFITEFPGSQFDGNWDNSTFYNEGDVVRHAGYIYYAIRNNYDSKPFVDSDIGSEDWIILAKTYKFSGSWSIGDSYKTGEIVLRGGNLYIALRDIGSDDQDGSTLDYLDDNSWELIVPGKSWKGMWAQEQYYSTGDIVYYKGTSYECNFEHLADGSNFPGDNGSGYDYWDILIQSGQPGSLQQKGDIITYGQTRDLLGVADTSSLGDSRVPIGQTEQILSVSSDLEVYWRNIVEDAESIFVSTNGIDDDNRGTFQNPFKTIRYAADYVEDNFTPGQPVIIRVSAGRFEEIGPIVVPAGCAVNGDELRTTTIVASGPIEEYQGDLPYTKDYLSRLEGIILNVLTGVPVTPTEGNTATQITADNFVPTETVTVFPESDAAAASVLVQTVANFNQVVDFRLLSEGSNLAVTGSNQSVGLDSRSAAVDNIKLNANFIKEELYNYLVNKYPAQTFNRERIRRDIDAFLKGVKRDLLYTGNQGAVRAAIRYVNAVNGSKSGDLFRMRDSTGLRDATTAGLLGELQPPGVFDLYQKPTGGACVALDPGWGPEDESVWITKRSPYIQNITNTGTGCVGKRVDGSLHNGGNRSMVSNDFTQVLSDGIGVWVSDNALTELVSVFTYYCQIGYFAEDGGIIRATNGNNSYGRYGSIADGADETEVPQNVQINNRTNEAQVKTAFAGGLTDEILLYEYENAGQNYTNATSTIDGAGDFAEVEFTDFRDDAIFEARLALKPETSGTEGGAGYIARQGAAQETIGASTSIRLSANDVTQDISEILGMRMIITDGTGVGQYGYISGFDFVTKSVDIVRESDDVPGWDHIIPGTPLEANLDLTTRYRIEPRVTVSAPSFNILDDYNLFANRTYVGLEYGDQTETFNNVSGAAKIDWVDDSGTKIILDSIVSATALQVNGVLEDISDFPFVIEGKTSGATTNVIAVTANNAGIAEIDISGGGNSFDEGEEFNVVLVSGTGNTFDDDPVAAIFNITRVGKAYTVQLANAGAGYKPNDTILITGNRLGGVSPDNDLLITVNTVTDDSASSILTFSQTGTGRKGRFVALTNAEFYQYSDDGVNWFEDSLPFIGDYKTLLKSEGSFLGLATNTDQYVYSLDGETWTTRSLPQVANWEDIALGDGTYVIVASDLSAALVSTNLSSWTSYEIPDDVGGDTSTLSQWSYIAYGKGTFLAVSQNDFATATSTDNGVTWTRHDEVLPSLAPAADWDVVDVVYGKNRFIILDSLGRTAYSFDGITWYTGQTLPGALTYTQVKYGNGVFLALGTDGGSATNTIVTSDDGIVWSSRTLTSSQIWGGLVLGEILDKKTWVLLGNAGTTDAITHVRVGAQALLRSDVGQGRFDSIKIWDPGSNYNDAENVTITVTDPNNTSSITPEIRIADSVLSQPDFVNRGSGYRTSTSTILISGDGFADIIPYENTLIVDGVTNLPGPGVQIRIEGLLDLDTEEDENDLKVFSGVEVESLGDDGTGAGTLRVKFTLSTRIRIENEVLHNTQATLRERYSQCRITGHDFLDIGTGNFETTNYPDIYAGGNFFTALPENEVLEVNGGRVFYTSTDQDGNFRTGELFAVQQSTGIVTISAQFFDLDGLSELSLGGVRLGGSGTVVNEFSTDPTFAADSNSVIPTQRAIATFLANRLSVGGENLEVNKLVGGRVSVGGFENEVDNVTGEYVIIGTDVIIDGTYTDGDEIVRPTGIAGTIISQMMFLKQFDETMQ